MSYVVVLQTWLGNVKAVLGPFSYDEAIKKCENYLFSEPLSNLQKFSFERTVQRYEMYTEGDKKVSIKELNKVEK